MGLWQSTAQNVSLSKPMPKMGLCRIHCPKWVFVESTAQNGFLWNPLSKMVLSRINWPKWYLVLWNTFSTQTLSSRKILKCPHCVLVLLNKIFLSCKEMRNSRVKLLLDTVKNIPWKQFHLLLCYGIFAAKLIPFLHIHFATFFFVNSTHFPTLELEFWNVNVAVVPSFEMT